MQPTLIIGLNIGPMTVECRRYLTNHWHCYWQTFTGVALQNLTFSLQILTSSYKFCCIVLMWYLNHLSFVKLKLQIWHVISKFWQKNYKILLVALVQYLNFLFFMKLKSQIWHESCEFWQLIVINFDELF